MKPITVFTSPAPFFYIGEGAPTVTAGIPVGALYINQTSGDHYLRRPSGWVNNTVVDANLSAVGAALLSIATPAGNSLLEIQSNGTVAALSDEQAAAFVAGSTPLSSSVNPVTSITVSRGLVTAAA